MPPEFAYPLAVGTVLRSQAAHPSVSHPFKRTIDLIGAILGLTILVFGFVPIAIAIVLDSPGPVLYCQVRCGYRGRPFRIWKFRSMVVNADQLKQRITNEAKGCLFKNQNDPRVTWVGRFLRRTSLDELPQFWNVLVGDMSLVGTRPPTPDEVTQYAPHHWLRLNVKPGMTGEWQVYGRSSVLDFEEVVKLDLRYQKRWSIAYDIRLLLRTLYIVFNRCGAW